MKIFLSHNRPLLASVIGNTLEYYDFALYGFMSPLIAKLFFIHQNATISMIMTLGVYAIGFLSRPLGGILFGYLGDVFGRKKSLSFSIIGMAISCFFMVILPTYHQIGLAAPLLLTLVRFMQGICMGGEYSGAVVFSLEHSASLQSKEYAGSRLAISTLLGCILASLTSSLCTYMETIAWLWRIPFLIGSVIGVCGLYLRYKVKETPEFIDNLNNKKLEKRPIDLIYKSYKYSLFFTMTLVSVAGITAGFSTTFLNVYLTTFHNFAMYESLLIVSFALAFYILGAFITSFLNRFVSPKKCLLSCLLLLASSTPTLLNFLSSGQLSLILLSQALFAFFSGIFWGNLNQTIYTFFPSNIRYTGIALSDSIARSFFAGPTPMLASWMLYTYNGLREFSVVLCLIFIITSLLLLKNILVETQDNLSPLKA